MIKKYIEKLYPRVPPSAPLLSDTDLTKLGQLSFAQNTEIHTDSDLHVETDADLTSIAQNLPSAAVLTSSAQNYRLKHIKDVQFELKRNLEIRNSLRKRYSSLNSSLDYSNYALNTVSCLSGVSSVSLLSTIALVPVSVILGGVSAGCGVASIIVSKLN